MPTAAPVKLAQPVAVIGAGSWGTALAIQFARSGRATRLWGRNAKRTAEMQQARRNVQYLQGAAFPETLVAITSLGDALSGASDVVISVPSHAFRATLLQVKPLLASAARLAWATKGFELDTGLLPHQVAAQVFGVEQPTAVLSGPTFASEVGAGLPTALTIASTDVVFATELAESLSTPNFRAYTSADVIGVEVGGAVKNVLAVGAGLSDGLGFGANTRIALITRGLAELTRLGIALGAQRETFMGLAALGDVVLTCTDNQSRNRRFGLLLAEGQNAEMAMRQIGQVVEGYLAARALRTVAQRLEVPMPICEGIYQTLYEGVAAREVVRGLMQRPIKAETD